MDRPGSPSSRFIASITIRPSSDPRSASVVGQADRPQRHDHHVGTRHGLARGGGGRVRDVGERGQRLGALRVADAEHDLVAHRGERRAQPAADVARSDDRDAHPSVLPIGRRAGAHRCDDRAPRRRKGRRQGRAGVIQTEGAVLRPSSHMDGPPRPVIPAPVPPSYRAAGPRSVRCARRHLAVARFVARPPCPAADHAWPSRTTAGRSGGRVAGHLGGAGVARRPPAAHAAAARAAASAGASSPRSPPNLELDEVFEDVLTSSRALFGTDVEALWLLSSPAATRSSSPPTTTSPRS